MDSKKSNLKKLAGFTLVEMVIAIGIFLVVIVSTYSSFRGGFLAYHRIEAELGRDYEFKMLARTIKQELRNSIEYAPVAFKGKSDGIQFPTRLRRYQGMHADEGLFEVTYRFRGGRLERSEAKLQKGLSELKKEKEDLIALESCRFQYAYEKNGIIEWRNEWSTNPYLGLPRAVQLVLKMKNESKKTVEKTIQILIPQGVLGSVK